MIDFPLRKYDGGLFKNLEPLTVKTDSTNVPWNAHEQLSEVMLHFA